MSVALRPGTALIYSIHGTSTWWKHIAASMGFENFATVSDLRGDGDFCVADDFYSSYMELMAGGVSSTALLTAAEVTDVIRRCRVLRWYPHRKAAAMALAMAEAFEKVLVALRPDVVVSFPIDRYGKDVLARRARAHGIPYFEFTASALPGMAMLLFRGRLVKRSVEPPADLIETKRNELADPLFTPSYVRGLKPYTSLRFFRVFSYFRLRGWGFKLIGLIKRDALNILYVDAQSNLGHKAQLNDVRVLSLIDHDWELRISHVPKAKRMAMPLQLFPEASIDYWIADPSLIDYEDVLVEVAKIFVSAGYHILVKDHPLQYGFRQVDFLKRLKALGAVTIIPYGVSGNELLSLVDIYFGLTGTLGLQAALLGLTVITAENYYTNGVDFVLLRHRAEIAALPARVAATSSSVLLHDRQSRIVTELLKGSFEGDYFSFRGFNSAHPSDKVTELGRALGDQVAALGSRGENWHAANGV